jgi:hypothetical protein
VVRIKIKWLLIINYSWQMPLPKSINMENFGEIVKWHLAASLNVLSIRKEKKEKLSCIKAVHT